MKELKPDSQKRRYGFDDDDIVIFTERITWEEDETLLVEAATSSHGYAPLLVTLIAIVASVLLFRYREHVRDKRKEKVSSSSTNRSPPIREEQDHTRKEEKIKATYEVQESTPENSAMEETEILFRNDLSNTRKTSSLVNESPKKNTNIVVDPNQRGSIPLSSAKVKTLSESVYDVELFEEEDLYGNTTIQTSERLQFSEQLSLDEAVLTVRETEKEAQNILLAQATYERNGIDPKLAQEYAVQRELSNRQLRFTEELEWRKLQVDALVKKQEMESKDRRHQEKMAAIKHDSCWREKIEQAYTKCWSGAMISCVAAMFVSMTLKWWQETSSYLRSMSSGWSLIMTMFCNCTEDDTTFAYTSYALSWLYPGAPEINTCHSSCFLKLASTVCVAAVLHYLMRVFMMTANMHSAVNAMLFLGLLSQSWMVALNGKLLAAHFLRQLFLLVVLLASLALYLHNFHRRRKEELESLGLSLDGRQVEQNLAVYNSVCYMVSGVPIFFTILLNAQAREVLSNTWDIILMS